MTYLLYSILFIFGLIVGSFINALAYRIENKISINGRSQCPNCKHQIAWYDLIPLVSYIIVGGKCRSCKKHIPLTYPIVEFLSGVAMVIYFNSVFGHNISQLFFVPTPGSWTRVLLGLFIVGVLVLIGFYDYKTGYVLSGVVYFAVALVLIDRTIYFGTFGFAQYLPYIYSSIGAASFFGLMYVVSKGKWMGAGDIEIALLLGLILGWPGVIVALYFAFITGSIVGLIKISRRESTLKSEMSFGPFLVSGIFFALLITEQLARIYAKIFLGY